MKLWHFVLILGASAIATIVLFVLRVHGIVTAEAFSLFMQITASALLCITITAMVSAPLFEKTDKGEGK